MIAPLCDPGWWRRATAIAKSIATAKAATRQRHRSMACPIRRRTASDIVGLRPEKTSSVYRSGDRRQAIHGWECRLIFGPVNYIEDHAALAHLYFQIGSMPLPV